jgi:hypothetical protein
MPSYLQFGNDAPRTAVGPRVILPQAIAEVDITSDLWQRPPPDSDYLREKLANQDLARQMSSAPSEILPRLVALAMDICGAESAGISILEPGDELFRWFALSGVLSTFEGATTPRNFSPCGVCLDRNGPVLMARPERIYDWIRDANITVPEMLLVPLTVKGESAIGTLWIVANDAHHFDSGHARVMNELAGFAGIALHMIQTEERLTQALQQQETRTKEMGHRFKNLFAITDSMIRMTSCSSNTKEELTERLSGRLHALANANALVRRSFGEGDFEGGSTLASLFVASCGRMTMRTGVTRALRFCLDSSRRTIWHWSSMNWPPAPRNTARSASTRVRCPCTGACVTTRFV